jgi:hypothetical protein
VSAVRVSLIGAAVVATLVAVGMALSPSRAPTGAPGDDASRENAEMTARAPTASVGAAGLSGRVVEMLDLDPATVRAAGSFPTGDGGSHDVYVARNRSGEWCLAEERVFAGDRSGGTGALVGGGCSPGPFGAGDVKVSVSGRGDTDAPGTRDVSVVGVAGSAVREIRVVLANGRTRSIALTGGRGFRYSVAASETGRAAAPEALQAFSGDGRLLSTTTVR